VIVLKKIVLQFLVTFACAFFTVSIFMPFLQMWWPSETGFAPSGTFRSIFWSFKKTELTYAWLSGGKSEVWFADYWGRDEAIMSALIVMFGFQLLTVLCSVMAIFRVKPYLLILSVGLNVSTTFCMWLVSRMLDPLYNKSFEYGFWFTFPSATLYLVAFLLSWRRRQNPIDIRQVSSKSFGGPAGI